MLEERTHVPFVGVVPYLPIELDDEDSLSERLSGRPKEGVLDLVVIRWPKVSNFTDFNPLARIPGVTLRYVDRPECFGEPDIVLLPGTKNVMGDLAWMRNNGLENCIRRYASQGGPVLGICGGYQMLGMTIRDPEHVESGGSMQGMGLLPVDTVYAREKVRTACAVRCCRWAVSCGNCPACRLLDMRFTWDAQHGGKVQLLLRSYRSSVARKRRTARSAGMSTAPMRTAFSMRNPPAPWRAFCCGKKASMGTLFSRLTPMRLKNNNTTSWRTPFGRIWI